MDFEMTTLGQVSCGGGKYGIAAPAVDFNESLPSYLRITDIRDDGCLDLSSRKSIDDPSASNYKLEENDIVFARTGNSTGRNYFYDSRDGEFVFAGFLIKFSLNPQKINPRYMKYYAQSEAYWNWVNSFTSGSTRGNINAKTYASMPLQLPERKVQDRIVSFCDSISDKIRANNQLNDYLGELCEATASVQRGAHAALSELCELVNKKTACDSAVPGSYVSTESLLPNKQGRQVASALPQTGKVTTYRRGDVLFSNIRPYFKKNWFADQNGTCSGDVLVFRAKNPDLASYLYSVMRSDKFFEYVMSGVKGTKMPRGDKKQMLTFQAVLSPSDTALKVIKACTAQMSINTKEIAKLVAVRDILLPRLMSGEIDVSKLDLTQQSNNHLADC